MYPHILTETERGREMRKMNVIWQNVKKSVNLHNFLQLICNSLISFKLFQNQKLNTGRIIFKGIKVEDLLYLLAFLLSANTCSLVSFLI